MHQRHGLAAVTGERSHPRTLASSCVAPAGSPMSGPARRPGQPQDRHALADGVGRADPARHERSPASRIRSRNATCCADQPRGPRTGVRSGPRPGRVKAMPSRRVLRSRTSVRPGRTSPGPDRGEGHHDTAGAASAGWPGVPANAHRVGRSQPGRRYPRRRPAPVRGTLDDPARRRRPRWRPCRARSLSTATTGRAPEIRGGRVRVDEDLPADRRDGAHGCSSAPAG